MPSGTRTRTPHLTAPALTLPPPFTLVTLREVGDAFAHAVSIAEAEGAGTLVYVGRFDLAEFAVVLEPDEPLRTARRAFYAGMAALADALLTYAPPEKPVTIDWPDTVRVDGGLVGGGRLAWPEYASEDEPPDWLVFGAMIRTVSISETEAGLHPLSAALAEEGFDGVESDHVVESFARHLMVHTDAWNERGFGAVAREFLQKLTPEKGVRRDLDENGDLLTRHPGKLETNRKKLISALAAPSWLDPKTGGPR
jgi:biotin-(acetyl-CoA carboxylase) ligase